MLKGNWTKLAFSHFLVIFVLFKFIHLKFAGEIYEN